MQRSRLASELSWTAFFNPLIMWPHSQGIFFVGHRPGQKKELWRSVGVQNEH
jgi:hypothetical protein